MIESSTPQGRHGAGGIAQRRLRVAQRELQLGHLGALLEAALVGLLRLGAAAQAEQQGAQRQVAVAQPGIQRQGLAQRRFGLGQTLEGAQHDTQQQPMATGPLIHGDGALQQALGLAVAVGVVADQSQIGQRRGVLGVAGEDATADRFGPRQVVVGGRGAGLGEGAIGAGGIGCHGGRLYRTEAPESGIACLVKLGHQVERSLALVLVVVLQQPPVGILC